MPLPRITHKARLFGILLTIFLIYWGLLPLLWPQPEFTATIPSEAPVDQDLVIPIRIRSWHPNIEVVSVRYYVDYYNSDVHGPAGTFYPQTILMTSAPLSWPPWKVNRFSWPRSQSIEAVLPLPQLVEEGVVQAGTVRGKLDVTLAWPNVHVRGTPFLGGFPNQTRMFSQPFEMRLTPSPE